MEEQDLYQYLKDHADINEKMDCKPVDLEFEEEMLIQILQDTIDTSWGRDILDRSRIERWLQNFVGSVFDEAYERKLALILAVHIVYYNEEDISYLVKAAYRKLLHTVMVKEKLDIVRAAESIVFYPLGTISESGPFLSYYFRKENNLPVEFFVNSLEKAAGFPNIKNIVLLDDVSISGGQVSWYLKEKKKEPLWNSFFQDKNFYALFLISTKRAKKRLEQEKVYLCAPIIMDERSQCFKKESVIYKMFDKGIRDDLREHSKYMAERYGYQLLLEQYFYNGELRSLLKSGKTKGQIRDKIKKDALGYDDSQVLIALKYNTPNNCLPIIWVENDHWVSLFKRYDKLYTAPVVGGIENETIYI